ncbi:MAG: adenylate/guanylate cyclase domain-containing protein [Microthrixaceae bacterium]
MSSQREGVLCFVFTDIEGSTAHWTEHPQAMGSATARLDEVVEQTMQRHSGVVIKDRGEGDSHFVVFQSPTAAIHACAHLVAAVETEPWPSGLSLRVRAGVHVGEALDRDGDYYGLAVNQTTRLRGLGHGGQVLASAAVVEMTEHNLTEGLTFRSLGTHRIRDFRRRQEIFQLLGPNLDPGSPRLHVSDLDVSPLAAVAMIDVVGASAIAAASDDVLVRAVESWQKNLEDESDQHNGTTLRIIGDGCVATFRDPRDAVEFARGVRDRLSDNDQQTRSGIHFGAIDVVGDDITGRSVFLTAELVRLANPGQILISPAARDLLDAVGFRTTPVATYSIPKHGLTWEASEA